MASRFLYVVVVVSRAAAGALIGLLAGWRCRLGGLVDNVGHCQPMKQQSAIAAVRREARASRLSSIIMVGVANGSKWQYSKNLLER